METTQTRKLSELIREGSKQYPPAKNSWFEYHAGVIHACPLVAAYLAAGGGRPPIGAIDTLMDLLVGMRLAKVVGYDVFDKEVTSPVSGDVFTVGGGVTVLTDEYRWTGEQIADWLEEYGL